MSAKTYKNPYTLDGRLKFGAGVSQRKVEEAHKLVDQMMGGDRIAEGKIKEAFVSTSDFALNFAQLVNATVLPELDDQIGLIGSTLSTTRTVSDFRAPYLYTLNQSWNPGVVGDGQVNEPLDTLPVVPEGTVYPEAFFKGELIENTGARKHGLRTGITWEALINDTLGMVQQVPGAFRNLATNTIERDLMTTLFSGVGVDQQLDAGTSVDGTQVPANAPLSRASLAVAMTQAKNQVKASYKGTVAGGFNVLVAVGQKEQAEWIINNLTLTSIQDGAQTLTVSGGNPLAGLTVIESVYITSPTAWFLVPKTGTTQRPVLERLTLAGHEQAELRISNFTGNYIGGSTVPPFEGSFNNDSADWRVRLVTGSVLWSPDAIVWSTGAPTP